MIDIPALFVMIITNNDPGCIALPGSINKDTFVGFSPGSIEISTVVTRHIAEYNVFEHEIYVRPNTDIFIEREIDFYELFKSYISITVCDKWKGGIWKI